MTEAEFQGVFNEHKDAVYRFAWRMTSSAAVAEDIAQDVFLTLFRQPNRFDPSRGTMWAFLMGIARNLTLKLWRDEERWEELGDDEFVTQPTHLRCNRGAPRDGIRPDGSIEQQFCSSTRLG